MTLATLAGGVGLAIFPVRHARSYCAHPLVAQNYTTNFPDQRIPVYLANTGNASIEHIGISHNEAARIVIDVVSRHNETVVSPKLYFAGFLNQDFEPQPMMHVFESWPGGIVINSFDCSLLVTEGDAILNTHLCRADTQPRHGCATHWGNIDDQMVGTVTLIPQQCQYTVSNAAWSMTDTPFDVAGVLMHELGHVLGLQHTNRTDSVCVSGGFAHGNHANGNVGIMHTPQSGLLPINRHWRRDDLDGLDHLYGEYAPIYETAVWNDDAFPNYPALDDMIRLSGTAVRRTAAMAGEASGNLVVVTIGDDHWVIEAILAQDGTITQDFTAIDPGPGGRTWGNPEIAIGTHDGVTRALVAWTAGESSTSLVMRPRWAIRELPAGDWSYTDGFDLRASRLTVGFDPSSGLYLLVTLSDEGVPELSTIDVSGQLLAERISLASLPVFEIGNVLCDQDTGCSAMYSTSTFGGPTLGRFGFFVDIDGTGLSAISSVIIPGQEVYGRVALVPDTADVLRGVSGWRRYALDLASTSIPEPQPVPAFPLRDWSLGLGAYLETSSYRHRLTMPVAVECGNGMLEAGEACDDGNLLDGDGCDGSCLLEPDDEIDDDETSDELGDTGETGDPSVLDNGGCECGVDRNRAGNMAGPMILALFGAARRRLRPTPAASPAPR